nr:PREDICTED: olfactory receptor 51Q1-like [Phalacrocorax carbo]
MRLLWFDAGQASPDAWFAQSFFLIHSSSFVESSVLPAMTSDCYAATYYLLSCYSVLTGARIDRVRLVSWAGPAVLNLVVLSMAHWYGKHASPLIQVIMDNVYLLVRPPISPLPMLNPFIYSSKTKQIHRSKFICSALS